jgi:DNA primase
MTTIDVEAVLETLGVQVLRETQDGELVAKCPMHRERTGRDDSHPSWSINKETLVHFCFSCHYSGGLTSLYGDLAGDVPENLEKELHEASVLRAVERMDAPQREVVDELPSQEKIDWLYGEYADVPPRLLDLRSLQPASAALYGLRWDRETKRWVIPIRDEEGALQGFQYRQKGFEDNYPKGLRKSKFLFGMDVMAKYKTVAIVESPLDAVRLHGVGAKAVASFGSWVSNDQAALLSQNFTTVVLALDNDAAGNKGSEVLSRMLKGVAVIPFRYPRGVKDPGDVETDEELRQCWVSSLTLGL